MKNRLTYYWTCGIMCLFTLCSSFTSGSKTAIPFKGKFFTSDNLGNLFLVQNDNSIEKYDVNGNKLTEANFKIYGNLSQLDVSNPFEIYAYYYDQQTLLILDNLLSLRAEISLSDISTSEVSAAARSFDNGIWYFDASNMRLMKTDKSLEPQIEGVPMATWTSDDWIPQSILDNEKNIFVLDSSNGIALFDVFGNYYKTLDLKGLTDFQVKKNKVVYFKNDFLCQYDFKLFTTDTLQQDTQALHMRIEPNAAFTWKNDSLFINKK